MLLAGGLGELLPEAQTRLLRKWQNLSLLPQVLLESQDVGVPEAVQAGGLRAVVADPQHMLLVDLGDRDGGCLSFGLAGTVLVVLESVEVVLQAPPVVRYLPVWDEPVQYELIRGIGCS